MSVSETRQAGSWWFAAAMGLLLAGYTTFIGLNFSTVASGSDSAGYLASGRLLAAGKLTMPLRTVPEYNPTNGWGYTPLGFDQMLPAATLRPTYPVGLPLHYAVAGSVAGWQWGPWLVGVLSAVAAVVVTYFCAREFGVHPAFAATGAAAVAVSAQFLYTSFLPLSDTPAAAWCAFAFLAALRSRDCVRSAIVSGLALSVAVMLRPANVILLPALLLAIGRGRLLLWAGLGALPGALFTGYYNHHIFGHPLLTGYGASVGDLFKGEYVGLSLKNYATTLPQVLPILFFGGLLLPWLPWRTHARQLAACLLWAASFVVVYAFYEFTHQAWWFLRFLLPAFPALAVLAACGLHGATERFGGGGRPVVRLAVALLLTALAVAGTVRVERERHFMLLKEYQEPYEAVGEWAKKNLPANALVAAMLASSSLYFYTDLPIMRWDAVDPDPYAALQSGLASSGRPFYAILFPSEKTEALARMPGNWRPVAEVKGVGIWQYGPAP